MKQLIAVDEEAFEIEFFSSRNQVRINQELYRFKIAPHGVILNDERFDCDLIRDQSGKVTAVLVRGKRIPIDSTRQSPGFGKSRSSEVRAPLNGQIVKIKLKNGSIVNEGDVILTLEAMKMENELTAPQSGVLKELNVGEKEVVKAGQLLFKIE